METIQIHTTIATPRMKYVCDFVFSELLGVNYEIVHKVEQQKNGVIIQYGHVDDAFANAYKIPAYGLLSEVGIKKQNIQSDLVQDLPVLFYQSGPYDLPFDMLSMVFFLLSRYEEYDHQQPDRFGRYRSAFSAAVIQDFLHLPLIDLWVAKLADLLSSRFNTKLYLTGSYQIQPTIDVDQPYAYRNKGIKFMGGGIKDLLTLSIGNLKARCRYIVEKKDPFDTYKFMKNKLLSPALKKPIFFFLNSNRVAIDINHIANHPSFAQLVNNISLWADIGIHPSGASHRDISLLKGEKSFIDNSIGASTALSRQHYLLINLPETYRRLLEIGVNHDFSMSYPDRIGFRASTSKSFLWYDLQKEQVTNLRIHSNAVMDVTLRYYLELSVEEAIEQCKRIKSVVEQVNGTFCFIWHNSNLSEAYGWKKWVPVFNELIK